MNTRHCILVLTAAFAYSVASVADADADRDEVPKLTVSFADLDLSKPTGARVLYRRIRVAAGTVCGAHESRQAWRIAASKACYRGAVEAVVAQVNRPLLTALHERTVGARDEAIQTVQR